MARGTPGDHLHVFVSLPAGISSPTLVQMGDGHKAPAKTRELWPTIIINATSRGDFGGRAALEPNGIFELLGTEPEFLKESRTKVREWRWIESDTVCFFLITCHFSH
jgi:hypothetical protein